MKPVDIEEEQETPPQSPTLGCPICGIDMDVMNVKDREMHVHSCLGEDDPDADLKNVMKEHPFAVMCPFEECGWLVDANDFVAHAGHHHVGAPHLRLPCPLCDIQGMSTPLVRCQRSRSSSNQDGWTGWRTVRLLRHLQVDHRSLMSMGDAFRCIFKATPDALRRSLGDRSSGVVVDGPDDEEISEMSDDDAKPATLEPRPPLQTLSVCTTSTVHETLSVDLPGTEEERECVICFEHMLAGQEVTRVGCLCVFHKKCLREWHDFRGTAVGCPSHPQD